MWYYAGVGCDKLEYWSALCFARFLQSVESGAAKRVA